MTQTNLYKYDAWQLIESMPDKSVDCIITDPLYDCELNLKELQRVCRGNIVVFCSPENQFFKPDEFAFWVKTPSTKNYSKHVGRFVEMILVMRGGAFNCLHWSQMTGVYDDRHINPPTHPFEKPLSLMERLVRIYSNPDDLVFDPFMGSGKTGEAAVQLGRKFIGCEISAEYFAIAEKRIKQATQSPSFLTPSNNRLHMDAGDSPRLPSQSTLEGFTPAEQGTTPAPRQ